MPLTPNEIAHLKALYSRLKSQQEMLVASAKSLSVVTKCVVSEDPPYADDEASPGTMYTEGVVRCSKYGYALVTVLDRVEVAASQPLIDAGLLISELLPASLSIGGLLVEKEVRCIFGGSSTHIAINAKPLANDPDMPSEETSYDLLRRYNDCTIPTSIPSSTPESEALSAQLQSNGMHLLAVASLLYMADNGC